MNRSLSSFSYGLFLSELSSAQLNGKVSLIILYAETMWWDEWEGGEGGEEKRVCTEMSVLYSLAWCAVSLYVYMYTRFTTGILWCR